MKKTISPLLLAFIFVSFFACKKQENKKEENTKPQYSVIAETINVNWEAYKTSDKTPVKGEFKVIEVSDKTGDTPAEALSGIEFKIPVSSLFSGDNTRDEKLKALFFGVMDATTSLTGTVNLDADGKGTVNLKMNGVSKAIPVTYTTRGQLVEFSGKLDMLEDFNATAAYESIHKACFDLHKGADGVSKTWTEVVISASASLAKK